MRKAFANLMSCSGVEVINITQLHTTKLEVKFCAG